MPLIGSERVFRILWGPGNVNALDFAFPVVGELPMFYRTPRPGSKMLTNQGNAIAWITGRTFKLRVKARYFSGQQNFGATGLQAFLDSAMDSNTFTLMPNIATPQLIVPGCYLEGPFTGLNPGLEQGEVQSLDLTIAHPTSDLGLAWRGLWFEYVAGSSLTDPVSYSFSRSTIGYEITPQGYLLQHPANSVCDGHYPDRVAGLQTTLVGMGITNDIANPEALDNASWTKSLATVTANIAKAPDSNLTADLLVEDTTATAVHAVGAPITVTIGDKQTGLVFLRAGGRFRALVGFNDAASGAGGNKAFVDVNLHTGQIVGTVVLGTGAVDAFQIIPLANQWYCIWLRGTVGTTASTWFTVRLGDASGNYTYTGDGLSGMYVWGATAVHTAANLVVPGDYTPGTSATDFLTAPWQRTPQSMFVVTDFIEGDSVVMNNGAGLFVIGQDGNTPFTRFDNFASPGYRFSHQTPNVALASTAPGVPAVGQRVQHLGNIFTDGSVEMRQIIAGGAETTGGRTGAIPFFAFWSSNVLSLVHASWCGGLHRLAIGPGTQPTLSQALLV